MIERAAAVAAGGLRFGAQRQQRAHGFAVRTRRLAGEGQRVAAVAVAQAGVGFRLGQQLHDAAGTGTRRFHQRAAAVAVDQVDVGAGGAQCAGDLLVAFGGGAEQRVPLPRIDRVDRGAMLEQQLHAFDIVVGNAGGGHQRRFAVGGSRLGAVLQQEFHQRPVGGAAGGGERADAGLVQRIDRRGGIQQHRRHAGVGAEHGAVQRRVAFGIGDQRAGTVGEQGQHRLGAAVPAVAGGGQQRGDAAAGAVHVGALGDQRAQQAGIRQQRGQHQHRALVAVVGARCGVGVGTGLDQGQRALDVAVAGGGQQGGGLFRRAGGALLLAQHRARCGDRRAIGLPARLMAFAQQRAQRAVGDHQAAQRQQQHAVDRQRGDARLRRQHAVQAGQRDRAERQHQQRERGRQEVAEEAFLARQVAAERHAAQGGGEDPRAVALAWIGVVPHEHQAERRPQPPQRHQRQD